LAVRTEGQGVHWVADRSGWAIPLLAVGHVPDPDGLLTPATRCQRLSIETERPTLGFHIRLEMGSRLEGLQVPNLQLGQLPSRDEPLSVGTEHREGEGSGQCSPRFLGVRQVPYINALVLAHRSEAVALAVENHTLHRGRFLKGAEFLMCMRVPKPHRPIVASRGQNFLIGAVGHAGDKSGVPSQDNDVPMTESLEVEP